MKSKSSTVTKQPQSATLPLITPGEFLSEEFLKPLGLSMNRLALALRIPVTRVQGIVNGHREITADTALRLARYFGTSAEYWINLQSTYDLKRARRDSLARIQAEVRKPRWSGTTAAARWRSRVRPKIHQIEAE